MTLQIWFWLFMALWVVVYGIGWRAPGQPWVVGGGYLLTFILLGILGWQVFGSPVK